MNFPMRIALIHALRHSPGPIAAAFAELWPEPTLMNLLDDSLSADLARDGALPARDAGDGPAHDAPHLAAKAALELIGCDTIALAQFSLARAATAITAATGRRVLTTPHSAVKKLRILLA